MNLNALDRAVIGLRDQSDARVLLDLPRLMGLLRRPGELAELLAELDRRREQIEAQRLEEQARELSLLERLAERWEGMATSPRPFEDLRGAIISAGPRLPHQADTFGRIAPDIVSEFAARFDVAAMDAADREPSLVRMIDSLRDEINPMLHAAKAFGLAVRTDPCFSLQRLQQIVDEIVAVSSPGDRMPRVIGIGGAIDELLFRPGIDPEVTDTTPVVDHFVRAIRDDLGRLLDELHLLASTSRARQLVVHRFAAWASWYGRDELRAVAADSPGKVEDRLTLALQKFLFDRGHTPIGQPQLGRVRPDLLDVSVLEPLYVEVKQHSDASPSASVDAAAQGVRQVVDSAAILAGTELALAEAFVVVFCLEGPAVSGPRAVTAQGVVIHLVFVDLVDWTAIGSRRRARPVVFTEDDILQRVVSASPPAI